jgi:hypothetical protein
MDDDVKPGAIRRSIDPLIFADTVPTGGDKRIDNSGVQA